MICKNSFLDAPCIHDSFSLELVMHWTFFLCLGGCRVFFFKSSKSTPPPPSYQEPNGSPLIALDLSLLNKKLELVMKCHHDWKQVLGSQPGHESSSLTALKVLRYSFSVAIPIFFKIMRAIHTSMTSTFIFWIYRIFWM